MPSALAPAKLNLALHVTGQRADGYHLLSSLVAFADVGDVISLTSAARDGLTVQGPFARQVPALRDNTLGKTLDLVRSWGEAHEPVHIELTKILPVAAGIGGGSADAAALLRVLLAGRPLRPHEHAAVAALGADIPMCHQGRPALVTGIGDRIQPVSLPAASLVLVNPGVEIATPAIFKALATKSNPPLADWPSPATFAALIEYLHTTRNDLAPPALAMAPIIAHCLDALRALPFAAMSGSGATCFGLTDDPDRARHVADTIRAAHPKWWVQTGKWA